MLVVRIILKTRAEHVKLCFTEPTSVAYKGTTYRIDPNCVFTSVRYGFMKMRTIDFIQGNPFPINYFGMANMAVFEKQSDTLNALVRSWFSNKILKFADYILIALCASIGLSLGALILMFMLASQAGVF